MVGLPNEILVEADKKSEWITGLHEEAEKVWKKKRNLNYLADIGLLK